MTNEPWQETSVLIWGKTYPELSTKYYETVCTGGTLADGRFIRLYPIPFRYLSSDMSFSKYQWLKVRIKKSKDDPRPESYKVEPGSISIEDTIESDGKNWAGRSRVIFQNSDYQFNSVEELVARNKTKKTSMGFVRPRTIDEVIIDERPKGEFDAFMKKLLQNKEKSKQMQMFDMSVEEVKSLEFISKRFKIHWHCHEPNCKGHKMSILDWEAYELVRKCGIDVAKQRVESILDLSVYDIGFFLGNFRLYPNTFAIGGIWYPKKQPISNQLSMFGSL